MFCHLEGRNWPGLVTWRQERVASKAASESKVTNDLERRKKRRKSDPLEPINEEETPAGEVF